MRRWGRQGHGSAVGRVVDDTAPVADGVDAVARQDRSPPEHAPTLPVREPQLGRIEGVLAVDPARHPVADERRIDGGEERVVSGRIGADQ